MVFIAPSCTSLSPLWTELFDAWNTFPVYSPPFNIIGTRTRQWMDWSIKKSKRLIDKYETRHTPLILLGLLSCHDLFIILLAIIRFLVRLNSTLMGRSRSRRRITYALTTSHNKPDDSLPYGINKRLSAYHRSLWLINLLIPPPLLCTQNITKVNWWRPFTSHPN